jgi:tetratricopeptide (TPR) repeat protein
MAIASEGTFGAQDDPLFSEGIAHLQAGEWKDAIRCLEILAGRYPDDALIQQSLEEAKFRARLDSSTRVRPKQFIFPWRAVMFRGLLLVLAAGIVIVTVQFINGRIRPQLARVRTERLQAQLVTNTKAFIEAEEFTKADETLQSLEESNPNHPEAPALAEQIADGRERKAVYDQAVELQQAGDLEGALNAFAENARRWPGYRDVNQRIQQIRDQQGQDALFTEIEGDIQRGACPDAVPKLERLQGLDVSYKRPVVEQYLVMCYLDLAEGIVNADPPQPERLPQALSYYDQALVLQPANADVGRAKQFLGQYLEGKQLYEQGYAARALPLLRAVYSEQPDFQGGVLPQMLYETLVQAGDQRRDAGDCSGAYELYRQAAYEIPVSDTNLAYLRWQSTLACITPTATPTNTPTATATPKPTRPPGPTPTATPPPPLSTFVNQIVFRSDNEEQPGFWLMNPDGSNLRYLGSSSKLQQEYTELREKETFDPSGRCRAYTTQTGEDASPQVYVQCQLDPGAEGPLPTWKVSKGMVKTSYDPVWAPDGSRIAFVSQNANSDDIWVADPLGESLWDYTHNTWEWDKHPSFSPDSQKIVFWSNREGTKQIYVIDADGRNLRKLSDSIWNEEDPMWIK